jgi:hypothetical protein
MSLRTRQIGAFGAGMACLLAGCGGAAKTVTVTTPANNPGATTNTATTTSPPTTTSAASGPHQCPNFGSPGAVPSGIKCTSNGILFTFEHQNGVVHLKTLNAQVVGVRTASSLSDGSISSATAQGEFVIITLTILNKTTSPQTFETPGNDPTALAGQGGRTYSENFDAENSTFVISGSRVG